MGVLIAVVFIVACLVIIGYEIRDHERAQAQMSERERDEDWLKNQW